MDLNRFNKLTDMRSKLATSESGYRSILANMVLEQDKGLFGVTGRSAIHLAAILGDLDMCKWLLNEGVDVRSLTKDKYEDSVLHCAAMNKSHGKELVRYFVSEHSFDVNAKDKLEFTPLHYALHKENIDIAEELFQLGADLTVKRITNDSSNLENLMHCCVSWNKMESAKFLQEKNRNLVKDLRGDGYTSLHIAAMYADLDMCKWLLDECGLDPHALAGKEKVSVLEVATINKSHGKEIITFLVNKYSLDVNRKNKKGLTPLHSAISANIVTAAELVRLGADLTIKCVAINESCYLENIMHYCLRKNIIKGAKFVQEMNRNLVKDLRGDGYTSLHIAAMHADLDTCKWLVDECGLDPRALAGKQKSSVLDLAACNKSHGKQIITFLVNKYSLDVNRKDKYGFTPLHQAFYVNNIVAAEELVRLGADIKVIKNGENLLHFCVCNNKVESAKYLIETFPGLIAKLGLDSRSVEEMVAERGDKEMMKLFATKGFKFCCIIDDGKLRYSTMS